MPGIHSSRVYRWVDVNNNYFIVLHINELIRRLGPINIWISYWKETDNFVGCQG